MSEPILTEQHLLLRDTVLGFARREIAPVADRIDREDWFPEALFRSLAGLGLLGINIPDEYGGAGADLLSGVIALEQVSRVSPSLALSYGAHTNLCAFNLYRNGSEAQRRRYLPDLCSGGTIGALAITEPDAGSDAAGISTRAVRDGDDFVLTGTKLFITNGPVADTLIVYAKTNPAAGAHGITTFIVERGMPGFSVMRSLDKVGHRGSPTGELVFEDCRVPAANVLGEVDRGAAVMMTGLDYERVFLAGEPVGIAEEAVDLSVAYARQRKQFGRPIGAFQMIQAKLAEMYAQVEAARWLVYRTAFVAGQGIRCTRDAAAALLFSAEVATRVTEDAVQVHGGFGYTHDAPVQRLWRDAKLMTIGAGTSEIRKLIIARDLLGKEVAEWEG